MKELVIMYCGGELMFDGPIFQTAVHDGGYSISSADKNQLISAATGAFNNETQAAHHPVLIRPDLCPRRGVCTGGFVVFAMSKDRQSGRHRCDDKLRQ